MIVLREIEKMNSLTDWERELALLENKSNLRKLPVIRHLGREVEVNGKVMLNLSSNDYLGLAAYLPLRTEFLQWGRKWERGGYGRLLIGKAVSFP